MTTIAEKAAYRALLLSDTELAKAGKLFDGRAIGADGKPITNTWYLTMQAGSEDDEQDRATGSQAVRNPSTTFQCSGSTPDQAAWVAERLDSVLRPGRKGRRLTVVGTRNDPLQRDYVSPVQIDKDVSPPMWFVTVEYSHRSQAAPTT